MRKPEYTAALDAACREYERLLAERAALDARLAKLHDTIASLSRLCGYEPTVPWGLTDAIRVVVNAARAPNPRWPAIGLDSSGGAESEFALSYNSNSHGRRDRDSGH